MWHMNFQLTYSVGAVAVLCALFLLTMARPSITLLAQTPERATLTIKVIGARNAKGKVGVALFQNASGFPEDASKAIRREDVVIDAKTLSSEVVFRDVRPGVYAVSVRHDEK